MNGESLRRSLLHVSLPFASTRLALFLWAWWSCLSEGQLEWSWLEAWFRWDAGWYYALTQGGYFLNTEAQSTAPFFPLFPLLSWLVSAPLRLGLDDRQAIPLAGLLVSQVSFLVGLTGVRRLMLARSTPAAAGRTVWLMCLFPFSYFFGAFYTESLYLALTVWAFALLEAGRDELACGLAALALYCRPQGVFMAGGVVLELARRRRPLAPALLVAVAALGIGLFFWREVGHPVGFVVAQKAFRGNSVSSVLDQLRQMPWLDETARLVRIGNVACLLLSWAAAPLIFRRYGAGYALATLLSVTVPSSTSLFSLGRYCSVVFPIFMLAGELLTRRWLYLTVLALWSVGLAYYCSVFATGGAAY